MWSDLAKFCHLGEILKAFGQLSRVYLVFGKIFVLFLSYWGFLNSKWLKCHANKTIYSTLPTSSEAIWRWHGYGLQYGGYQYGGYYCYYLGKREAKLDEATADASLYGV